MKVEKSGYTIPMDPSELRASAPLPNGTGGRIIRNMKLPQNEVLAGKVDHILNVIGIIERDMISQLNFPYTLPSSDEKATKNVINSAKDVLQQARDIASKELEKKHDFWGAVATFSRALGQWFRSGFRSKAPFQGVKEAYSQPQTKFFKGQLELAKTLIAAMGKLATDENFQKLAAPHEQLQVLEPFQEIRKQLSEKSMAEVIDPYREVFSGITMDEISDKIARLRAAINWQKFQ